MRGLKGPGWVRFPFASAIFSPKGYYERLTAEGAEIWNYKHVFLCDLSGLCGKKTVETTTYMLNNKRKIIVFCVLVAVGAAALTYGIFFHSTTISPAQATDLPAISKSEPALIKEVSVGGLERDASGQVKKTYTGKAPQACPT